jgi:hypothetical protein
MQLLCVPFKRFCIRFLFVLHKLCIRFAFALHYLRFLLVFASHCHIIVYVPALNVNTSERLRYSISTLLLHFYSSLLIIFSSLLLHHIKVNEARCMYKVKSYIVLNRCFPDVNVEQGKQ